MWLAIRLGAFSEGFDPADEAHHRSPQDYQYTAGGRRKNPLTGKPYNIDELNAVMDLDRKRTNLSGTTFDDLDDLKRLRQKYDVEPDPDLNEVRQLAELRAREKAEQESQWAPNDLKGMSQRIPGWFTGDAMMAPPPDHGDPGPVPLPRRAPGQHYVDPARQVAPPRRQTYDEWVQSLKDKGVWLNPDGTRMTPEEMAAPLPRRSPTSPTIWQQFVDAPSYNGREVMAAFVKAAVGEHSHNTMISPEGGWTFHGHYPGETGSWYHKTIGGRTHVIAKDDGWIHNSAPADAEPDEYGEYPVDETPMGYKTLGEAVLAAEMNPTVGFRAKPPSSIQRMNSTWEEQ